MDSKAEAIEKAWEDYVQSTFQGRPPPVGARDAFHAGFNAGASAMHVRHMIVHKSAQNAISELQQLMWAEDK